MAHKTACGAEKAYLCGIAEGFPPYPFKNGNEVTGFDSDVLRLVLVKLSMK